MTQPSDVIPIALDRQAAVNLIATNADSAVGQLWAKVPLHNLSAWKESIPDAHRIVTGGQLAAARGVDTYLARLPVGGTAGSLTVSAFAQADLATLLTWPLIRALDVSHRGAAADRAHAVGRAVLSGIARSMVHDAARDATHVGMVARRAVVGYIRVVSGRTCARCLILSGRWYAISSGFLRHPRCDCVHVPAASEIRGANPRRIFDAMSAGEQDAVFGAANARAVRDGASLQRVVNANSGMSVKKGRIAQIYRIAGENRTEAIRLLKKEGFIS